MINYIILVHKIINLHKQVIILINYYDILQVSFHFLKLEQKRQNHFLISTKKVQFLQASFQFLDYKKATDMISNFI